MFEKLHLKKKIHLEEFKRSIQANFYFNNIGIFTAADSNSSGVPLDEDEVCHKWTGLFYSSLTQRGQGVAQWRVV